MEPLVNTWSAGQQVESADLNSIQQNAQATRQAVGAATNSWATVANGTQGVTFQSASTLANATVLNIDASIDWRDRVVFGWFYRAGAADTQPGGANDTNYQSGSGTWDQFMFYTGTGGVDGGGNTVTDGNPPASGYYFTLTGNVYLLCAPSAGGGKLQIYNGTGGDVYCPALYFIATPDLGKR